MSDINSQIAELRVEVSHTRRSIDKMTEAFDRLSSIEAKNQARDEKIADHEVRLRAVEKAWLKVGGGLALLSATGPLVAKSLGWL